MNVLLTLKKGRAMLYLLNCFCCFGVFFLMSFQVSAQQVQWAGKVLGVSSERSDPTEDGPQYKAVQILGKPSKLPQTGSSRAAWSPAGADTNGDEWIKVGFERPMKIRLVCVAENHNPGAIIRIFAADSANKEHLIHENIGAAPTVPGRMWNVVIPQTSFKVYAIKLVMTPSLVRGYNEIDAVGVSEVGTPYEPKINVAKNIPKEIVKENLGRGVNTRYKELAPIVAPDGKSLYFTREGHDANIGKMKSQDVWVSKIQPDGTWGEAENLRAPINNEQHNAVASVSSDGKLLYLLNIYRPDGLMFQGLSTSKKTQLGWEFPKEVKIDDYYTLGEFSEFTLAPNNRVLVIASKRKDTRGGKDLYVSFRNDNDSWSKPLNIGADLNTVEDEIAPFIAADSRTIYFSTEGLPGFGNNDIFMSRRLDSTWTHWSEPENIGPLINTPKWDAFFTIPASGEYAYLSSVEKSFGSEDIFRLKLFPSIKPDPVAIISGVVINANDKKPLAADVLMEVIMDTTSHDSKDKILSEFDPSTGEFKFVVPLKKSYGLSASKKGFLSVSETIDLSKDNRYREIRRTISLIPIKEGEKIVLNNLFFNQSKFDILAPSFPELARIIDLMKEYPTMEVLIEGHTDGADDNLMLNVKLSQDRANEVKKYLVEKGGINPARIQTKGWGPSRPIASNAIEETRKKNRRVEFSILKL
ncbi:OmpA family protein [Emticicia sp. 21SJ11W-3]|uniref:OmpA family protein n=1 Tax=Emticicia sp. 21SJ11W-3 TaxID=2916755 RepID=UPI00209EAA00|nr:OmpA family protein [Emticicia sp. 21SJ11W-3]UTA66798.1 OmpA family protein [Emticicia sp. 21SJ11W-3]